MGSERRGEEGKEIKKGREEAVRGVKVRAEREREGEEEEEDREGPQAQKR